MKQKKKSLFDPLLFLVKFFKNPTAQGSLIPSSRIAGRSMLKGIPFDKVETIVELGPGLGTFTREYLRHAKPEARIILFEVDVGFRQRLRSRYGERLILAEDATSMNRVLEEHGIERIDLIVSSLPFTLGDSLQDILRQIKPHTDRGAIFRAYTYFPFMMKKHYRQLEVKRSCFVLRNLPPMWIYGVN